MKPTMRKRWLVMEGFEEYPPPPGTPVHATCDSQDEALFVSDALCRELRREMCIIEVEEADLSEPPPPSPSTELKRP